MAAGVRRSAQNTDEQCGQQMGGQQNQSESAAVYEGDANGADDKARASAYAKLHHATGIFTGDLIGTNQLVNHVTTGGVAAEKSNQNSGGATTGQTKKTAGEAIQSAAEGSSDAGASEKTTQY